MLDDSDFQLIKSNSEKKAEESGLWVKMNASKNSLQVSDLPPDSPHVTKIDQSVDAYKVTVPEGVLPGQHFRVTIAGRYLKVKCPPRARVGSKIRVTVPPLTTVQQANWENQQKILQIAKRHPGPYFTHVPPMTKPGEMFRLTYAGVDLTVKVPPGGVEKQRLWFMLGERQGGDAHVVDGHIGKAPPPPPIVPDEKSDSAVEEEEEPELPLPLEPEEEEPEPSESNHDNDEEPDESNRRQFMRPQTMRGMSFDDDDHTPEPPSDMRPQAFRGNSCDDLEDEMHLERQDDDDDNDQSPKQPMRRAGRRPPARTIEPEPPHEDEEVDLRHVGEIEKRVYGWEVPEWAGKGLRPTGKGDVIKQGASLAAQPSKISDLMLERNIKKHQPEWQNKNLRPTGKGDVIKQGQSLAVAPSQIAILASEKNIKWEKPEWTQKSPLKKGGNNSNSQLMLDGAAMAVPSLPFEESLKFLDFSTKKLSLEDDVDQLEEAVCVEYEETTARSSEDPFEIAEVLPSDDVSISEYTDDDGCMIQEVKAA